MSNRQISDDYPVIYPPKRAFSYVIIDNGPQHGADLFKVFVESGGSVHLANFDGQTEALAFVKSLKTTARVVVL